MNGRPRHHRRLSVPNHRDRHSLFLFVVDPFDPARHRCRARRRSDAHRGGDRLDLGGGGGAASPSARNRPPRYGRLRRRHVEIPASSSGPPPHPRRGFGKLAKLAAGHLDLHSARSRLDLGWLAARLAETGAPSASVAAASAAAAPARCWRSRGASGPTVRNGSHNSSPTRRARSRSPPSPAPLR